MDDRMLIERFHKASLPMKYLLLPLAIGACSSNVEQANPCATPDSTYIQSSVELSGNCGALPNVIVNINPDGTITFPSNISCQTQVQDGCTARDSDCYFGNNGISCQESFETTFAQDGSSAQGLLTLSCSTSNGQNCTSTYSISMVRE